MKKYLLCCVNLQNNIKIHINKLYNNHVFLPTQLWPIPEYKSEIMNTIKCFKNLSSHKNLQTNPRKSWPISYRPQDSWQITTSSLSDIYCMPSKHQYSALMTSITWSGQSFTSSLQHLLLCQAQISQHGKFFLNVHNASKLILKYKIYEAIKT